MAIEAAVAQIKNLVKAVENFLVVRYCDNRGILLDSDFAKHVHHDSGALGVQCCRRLVGENNPRPVGECACNGDPLRLAAGEFGWHRVLAMTDFEVVQQLDRALPCGPGICASELQHESNIVSGIEEGDQIVKGISGSFSNVVGLPVERLREELEAWSQVS